MSRVILVCEYDGTDFCGFQIQDNGRTVQEELEKALSELYKTNIKITGCSRTDAGVHARGHCSSFDAPFDIPEDRIPLALNSLLPNDLSVKKAVRVKDDFSARFNSLGKRYCYRIYASQYRSPLIGRYSYYTSYTPDISKMRQAAVYFAGEHDFAAFCAVGGSQKTTVRKLFAVNVFESKSQPGLIEIEVQGEAFLYNMVRIIAGTLYYVGIGKIEPDEVKNIIDNCDRSKAGKTLPACGLTLEEVYYDWGNIVLE